jgi:hypothetical protein
MDTTPPDPGLSVEPAARPCPHCGAGCGGVADPTGPIGDMLTELASLNLRMLRLSTEQAEAVGHLGHEDAVVHEIISRNVRRTLAMKARLYEDSKKTPEQLAAERAQRAAAAERARLRDKTATAPAAPGAAIKRESGPSDRENLLGDLRERLLHPDMEIALLQEDIGTVVMRVLRDVGIAPKNETWSLPLMAYEIAATSADFSRIEAERAAGQAAAASGVDWREGVEFSKPPDVETTTGRFTFAPGGLLSHEDPPETPESEWPPDILGRPPPDTLRRRKPPDTG